MTHQPYSNEGPPAFPISTLPAGRSKLSHSQERKGRATQALESIDLDTYGNTDRTSNTTSMARSMTKASRKKTPPRPIFRMLPKTPPGMEGLNYFDDQDEEIYETPPRKRNKTNLSFHRSPETLTSQRQSSLSGSEALTSTSSLRVPPPISAGGRFRTPSNNDRTDRNAHSSLLTPVSEPRRTFGNSSDRRRPIKSTKSPRSQGTRIKGEQSDHSRMSPLHPPQPKLPKDVSNPPFDMNRLVATLQEVPHIITGIQTQYAELFRKLGDKVNAQEDQIAGLRAENSQLRQQMDTIGADIVDQANDRMDEIERRFNEKMQELIDSNDEVVRVKEPVPGGDYGGPKFAPPQKKTSILESLTIPKQ